MLTGRTESSFHLDARWFQCWSAGFGKIVNHESLYLVADRGPMRVRRLRGATNPHSVRYDAAPWVSVPADLPARLFARGVAVVQFDYLDADGTLLRAARGWGGRVRIAPHARSPVVDCRGSYDRWFAARSKRIRQRLRSDGRAAFERMGMRTEFRGEDPTASDLFGRMLAVEASGWKGRGGTAIRDHPGELRFYTALVRAAAQEGALHIALMWHGDTLAAFELGIRGSGRLFLLKVGYDEQYGEVSVGYLLAAAHIRQCFDDPRIDWYDKMGNGMSPAAYKLRFADRCDTLYRVTAYAPGLRGGLAYLHDAARGRAKAWRQRRREKGA